MKKKELEAIVENVLEKYRITRQDDFNLIYGVQKEICPEIKTMTYSQVMRDHKELGLPSFESITRCRRKIFERRQDLIDWGTAVKRAEEKEEILNYVRGEE